jgi:1,5-anhydro-D-fructose reductase (1,5-anhydro-D-mannitol-forming)
MTLGWGIIGLGYAADELVCPAVSADANSRLVAVVSRDQSRAEGFASKHGAELATTDYAAMLADERVDVVAVTSPNALHAEQAIAAARAGKHVYCDKPMAGNVEDAKAVVDAGAKAGVRIGMNFQTRHHTCFEEAKRVIDDGEVGEIIAIQVDASPGAVPLRGWRSEQALAGLGAVNNIAVHIYDLVRFLVGAEVSEVSAMFDVGREDVLERMPMVLMRFTNGTMVFANGNQVTPLPLNDIVIHGSTGRIDGRGITRPLKEGEMRVVTSSGESTARYSSHDCYIRTVAAYSRAILDDRDPDPSGMDGLRNIQLTDAIRTSAREGRVVKVAS